MIPVPVFDTQRDASTVTRALWQRHRFSARLFFIGYGISLGLAAVTYLIVGTTLSFAAGAVVSPLVLLFLLASIIPFVINARLETHVCAAERADFERFHATTGQAFFQAHATNFEPLTTEQERNLLRGAPVVVHTTTHVLRYQAVSAGDTYRLDIKQRDLD